MKVEAQNDLVFPELRRTTDPTQLTRIPDTKSKISDDNLRKAAQDFEAIIVAQFLRNMRQSLSESGLFGKGVANDIYSSMFDQQIAQAVASKNGFHLSDIIINSLQEDGSRSEPVRALSLSDYRAQAIIHRTVSQNPLDWDRTIIQEAAQRYDVDAKLVESVIKVESDFRANAVSKKGAVGLMQLMQETAEEVGVANRYDPKQNVFGGTRYLKKLLQTFDGNLELALSAYNAGPNAVHRYNGIPPYKETQRYVKKVLEHYRGL